MSRSHRRPLLVVQFAILLGLAPQGCSGLNRNGPETSCSDLQNGAINACKEGIIASCSDGKTVTYEVCTEGGGDETCEAEWQVKGAFACQKPSTETSSSCLPAENSVCYSCLSGVCGEKFFACTRNATCSATCRGPLADALASCFNQCKSGDEPACAGSRLGSP